MAVIRFIVVARASLTATTLSCRKGRVARPVDRCAGGIDVAPRQLSSDRSEAPLPPLRHPPILPRR